MNAAKKQTKNIFGGSGNPLLTTVLECPCTKLLLFSFFFFFCLLVPQPSAPEGPSQKKTSNMPCLFPGVHHGLAQSQTESLLAMFDPLAPASNEGKSLYFVLV